MLHSIFSVSSLGVGALALAVACSSAQAPSATPPVAVEPSAVEPVTLAPAANEPAPSGVRPIRPSSMQTLEQLVTAQALLVSLLLTPLSKDGAEQVVARADAPQGAAPAVVR